MNTTTHTTKATVEEIARRPLPAKPAVMARYERTQSEWLRQVDQLLTRAMHGENVSIEQADQLFGQMPAVSAADAKVMQAWVDEYNEIVLARREVRRAAKAAREVEQQAAANAAEIKKARNNMCPRCFTVRPASGECC